MLLNENPDILSYDSTGYSMYPALKPGDQLIVKPVQDYCKGDIVVFTHGGRSVTHRFIERNGDILTFLGDRLIYSEKVHVSQVTGKVMLVIRNGNTFDPPKKSRLAFFYRISLGLYFQIRNSLRRKFRKQN